MKISFVIKLTVLIAFAAGFSGCKKALEEVNPSGTTAEAVYTTPQGFETLVNAAYSYSRAWYGKEDGIGMAEMGTDLWTLGDQGNSATNTIVLENKSLVLYQNLSPVNQNVTRLWKNLYAAVNLCNMGIKIEEDGQGFDPDNKRVAELRALRAFYYWHIVETWGGVHFSLEPTETADLTANRTPVLTFYDQITKDLEEAILVLPSRTAVEQGRISQPAAKAFLARAYLSKAYYTKDPLDFQKASQYAQEVMTAGYALVDNYESIWSMTNEKNSEVIWSVPYSQDPATWDRYNETTCPICYGVDVLSAGGSPTSDRGNNNLHMVFIPIYDVPVTGLWEGLDILDRSTRYGRPFNRFMPTKFLLSLYDQTLDARFNGTWQTVWKVNQAVSTGRLKGKIKNVDTATVINLNPAPSTKYYAISVDTVLYNSIGKTVFSKNKFYPSLKKFQDSLRSPSPNDNATTGANNAQGSKDVFVIRYAEMYLIAAEAEFQLGNAAGAANFINLLRDHRALPTKAFPDLTAGDITLDFILDERAREFAGENIRWFDLKRTGKLVERVQLYNPDVAPFVDQHHLLRPIPQVQIDVVSNKSTFTQNPGY